MSTFSDQFRIDFPEFSYGSPLDYPDSQVDFWYDLAGSQMNVDRWGDFLLQGQELYVAHNLSLSKARQQAALAGQVPGQVTGVLSSQSAGGVSASLDTSSTAETEAGNYNLTVYGRQFIRLARIVGSGGLYLI